MLKRIKRRLDLVKTEIMKEVTYAFARERPRKLVFDHLPKCAGTSLNAYLMSHYPRRKIFVIDGVHSHASVERFKRMSERKRHGYDLVVGHYANALFNDVHPDCLKVTLLREPVDRLVSHYYYVSTREKHYLHQTLKARNISLEAYADPELSTELSNWYTTHFSGMTLSEANRHPDEAVAKAIEVLETKYDVVGIVEELYAFVARLRQKARLGHDYGETRVNTTKNRPKVDTISSQARQNITEANKLDIAVYTAVKARLAQNGSAG
jgi:hypothetical protein